MVTTGLSEFSFGFGFLQEQIVRIRQEAFDSGTAFTAVPIFPTQQQEAERGYDVYLPKFGTDYYYQFKISEYYKSMRARWRRNALKTGPNYHDGPYYSISLHKANGNQQHKRLRALSQDKEHTYYVTPEFTEWQIYNNAFLNGTITENTRSILIKDCDDITDNKQHFITFQPGDEDWIQHSDDMHLHKGSIFGKRIFSVYNEHKPTWKRIDDDFTSRIFTVTSDIAKKVSTKQEFDEKIGRIEHFWETRESPWQEQTVDLSHRVKTILKTSQLCSAFFGANLVLVGTRESNSNQ